MGNGIEFKNITKKFGNFYANKNISFAVKENEIHAILGENGAGKSTLMNILFGIYTPDEGQILLNDQEIKITNPNVANAYKIGMVHQHFQLIDTFTVAQNIVLGSEITKGLVIDQNKTNQLVQEVIDKYQFNLKATDLISNLTVGQQQKVEILKMLFIDAKYLIFDEPSGALTPQETEELLSIIEKLRDNGKTIILITHKLKEIRAICDRCTVIRKGEVIDTVNLDSVSNEDLATLMVGHKVEFDYSKNKVESKEVKLELKNVSVGNKVKNVSFKIHGGEILSIAGIDGNGQLELIEAIMGMRRVTKGEVIINGQNMTNANVRKINDNKVGYVPQDRHRVGLVLDYSVSDNAILKQYYKKPFCINNLLRYNVIDEFANSLIESDDIRCSQGVNTMVRNMSGGNQQKLIIAREIANEPEVLILMQPTRGIDIGAIANIHKKIIQELEKGVAILLVSLELSEVMQLSDRIAVIHEGEIMGIKNANETNEDEIGLMMAGERV